MGAEQIKGIPAPLYGAFCPAFERVQERFAVVYELLPSLRWDARRDSEIVQAFDTVDPRCDTAGLGDAAR